MVFLIRNLKRPNQPFISQPSLNDVVPGESLGLQIFNYNLPGVGLPSALQPLWRKFAFNPVYLGFVLRGHPDWCHRHPGLLAFSPKTVVFASFLVNLERQMCLASCGSFRHAGKASSLVGGWERLLCVRAFWSRFRAPSISVQQSLGCHEQRGRENPRPLTLPCIWDSITRLAKVTRCAHRYSSVNRLSTKLKISLTDFKKTSKYQQRSLPFPHLFSAFNNIPGYRSLTIICILSTYDWLINLFPVYTVLNSVVFKNVL